MAARSSTPPRLTRLMVTVIAAFLVAFVGWAAYAEVDEIAQGNGKIIPASKTQLVQASEPGIVNEIAVRVGQVVRKGDLIIRLDDTASTSMLGEQAARARALSVRVARLKQEQRGEFNAPLACPEEISKAAPEICENEQNLLKARRENFENKASVLQARAEQRRVELKEAQANIARLTSSLEINSKSLELVSGMVKRGLMARTEEIRLEGEQVELRGQLSLANESLPRISAAISEAELQVSELSLQFEQEALDELTQTLSELSVINETIRGASDRVARTDIRSPVDGIVNTLEVNTLGAFVQPGAVVAGIVPTSETLLVEARVSPRDVAFIQQNQSAMIKISSYDFAVFGGLQGEVANISADSLVDQETGEPFYQVRVATRSSTLERAGKTYPIIPGMICTVEIMTGRKTILEYLLKPINRARNEALRER